MRSELDGIHRTFLGTQSTADTLVVDCIGDQVHALAGGTMACNMSFIFFPEIMEGGENRVGRRLAQTTKTSAIGLLEIHILLPLSL